MKRIFVENAKHCVIATLQVNDGDTAYIDRGEKLTTVSRYDLEIRKLAAYLADLCPEFNESFLEMQKTVSAFSLNSFESIFPIYSGGETQNVNLWKIEHVKDIPANLSLIAFMAFLSVHEMDLVIKPRDVKFSRVLDFSDHLEENPYCAPDSEECYHHRTLKFHSSYENK